MYIYIYIWVAVLLSVCDQPWHGGKGEWGFERQQHHCEGSFAEATTCLWRGPLVCGLLCREVACTVSIGGG